MPENLKSKMRKIRRIPTILGLLLLLAGLGAGIIGVHQGITFFLKAAPEIIPKQVKITNIADTSFTVSWITDTKTSGFVKYGEGENLAFTVNDDRDQVSNQTGEYLTHYFTLKNLKPKTAYTFKLGSGGKTFDNNGQAYQVTTGLKIQTPAPASDVVYGSVAKVDGSPASGAIVYLSLANTTPQSSLAKSSGSWVIPLNLARSTDLASYASYDQEASIEEIFIQAGTEGTATAVAVTRNDSPLPTITLGQNFDFRKTGTALETQPKSTPTEEASPTASKFNLENASSPSAGATVSASKELTITNPEEKETVTTEKPAFFGTAPAGKILTITVESEATQSGSVVVDANGDWEWTPSEDLEPGEHTITASYIDDEGNVQTVSRTFTVLAAADEDLPSFETTPSGETTDSGEASPTATPTLSLTPTATPSATDSGRTSLPSTDSGVPESGYLTPTFLVSIMGLGLIVFGLFSHSFLKKKI